MKKSLSCFRIVSDQTCDESLMTTSIGSDVMKQAPPAVSAKLSAQSTHWHETERRRYGGNIYRR
jgi:hypothetical protein